jgi:IgGFc binding protein/type IX secretion system substrate protein
MKAILSMLLLCHMLIIAIPSFAQEKDPTDPGALQDWLPTILGSNNSGTEFYLTFHPCWEQSGTDNFLKIYISSGVRTRVTVTVEGKGFEQSQYTVPNDIIVFNLPPNIGQAYAKDHNVQPEDDQVWKQYAVHVDADDPIICYGVSRFQYTSDGYLAIPLSSLGKEYIVSSWSDIGSNTIPGGQFLTSYTSCITPYDKSRVRFTGGGPSFSHTTTGIMVGESKTFKMNRGDLLLMASIGSYSDLSGSKFTSNKNISVISGNFAAYVPEFIGYADYLIEQDLPTHTWGTEYHVTPINKRKKNSWIKIYAKQSGTELYRDGNVFASLTKGGGAREGECYLSLRALDETQDPRPVVISSNNPISVTQYNTGQDDDGVPSDPFQMVLTPLEQFQTEIIFNTPGVGGDGFSENYVNLVYESTTQGAIPSDLEFGQVENGKITWKKMSNVYPSPGQEFIGLGDARRMFAKILTLPGEGVYKIRASRPFAAYAYGFSSYDSYGFPTSVALGDLEKPDVVAPICEPFIDCFGVVRDARNGNKARVMVTDMPDDDELRSNMATVIAMPFPISYNFKFDKEEIIPGETRDAFWTAHVVNVKKKARLIVIYKDRRGNSKTDTIYYYPYQGEIIAVDDKEGDFGTLAKGESKTLNYIIKNNSDVNTLEISYLKMLSNENSYWTWERYREEMREDQMKMPDKFKGNQGFKILTKTGDPLVFNISIPPLGEYPFQVRFDAVKEGTFRDSIGIGESENCFFGYWLPVKAAVGEAIIEVSDYDFGEIKVNETSAFVDINIKNIGTTDLIITDFSEPTLMDGTTPIYNYRYLKDRIDPSQNKALTLAPDETFTYQVSFNPTQEIDYPDEMIFTSNANTNKDNVAKLGGRGTKAALIVRGYRWQEVRIDRPGTDFELTKEEYPVDTDKYPDGGYPLYIENTGSADLKITQVLVKTISGEAASFWFKKEGTTDYMTIDEVKKELNTKTIESKESRMYEAYFLPTSVGVHEIEVEFHNSASDPRVVTFYGVGIVPYASSIDVDFDWTFRNDFENRTQKDVHLMINTSEEGDKPNQFDASVLNSEFGDDVTIFGITIKDDKNKIKTEINLEEFGTEGFRFDLTSSFSSAPIMKNAEKHTIKTAEFLAPDEAYNDNEKAFSGTIIFHTDAWELDIECTWTATGFNQDYSTECPEQNTCIGRAIEAYADFFNTGKKDIEIISVRIVSEWTQNGTDPDVDVLKFASTGTQLLPGEIVTEGGSTRFDLIYNPNLNIDYKADIIITARINGVIVELPAIKFVGSAFDIERDMNITLSTNNPKINTREGVEVVVGFENPEDCGAAVQRLKFEISYDRESMLIRDDNGIPKFEVGSHLTGWTLNQDETKVDHSSGKITAVIDGPSFPDIGSGELLKFKFDTYLPPAGHNGNSGNDDGKSVIKIKNESFYLNTDNNTYILDDCLTLNPTEDVFELEATCVYDLRKLSRPGNTGSILLEDPVPNPLQSQGMATIDFMLVEDGNASFVLYNSNGDQIEVIFEEFKEKGSYQITIDASKLQSGVYHYELQSGNYRDSKKLLIVK